MIPYFPPPSIDLGPLTLHAFGLLVAAAIVVGVLVFRHRAARTGLDVDVAGRLASWVVLAGFVGAHLGDRLLYNFEATVADPWSLLFVWQGISSYGGFAGGVLGAWLFFRRNPQGTDTWRYLDALAYALPFAWVLGRTGCFLAYDHVGVPTDWLLGQRYADGVVRHNMGLLEALYSVLLVGAMVGLGRRTHPPGWLVGSLALLYAPGRFLLDLLRVSDERHAGLLVSQYASIALAMAGAWVLWRAHTRSGREDQPGVAGAPPRERETTA